MPEQQGDTRILPLFSLCLYLHNQRHLLKKCLRSILEQTYPALELVVFDDGSCDFDETEVQAYIEGEAGKNLQSLQVIHHATYMGPTTACKRAVALSIGQVFGCISPDTPLKADWVLDRIAKRFISPHVQVVCARVQVEGLKGSDETIFPRWNAFQEISRADAPGQFSLMAREPWGTYAMENSVFWRRDFYDELGGYDADYRNLREWPLLLRACLAGTTLTGLDVPVVQVTHKQKLRKYESFSPEKILISLPLLKDAARVLDDIAWPFFANGGFLERLRFQIARKQTELFRIAKEEWYYYGLGARLRIHLDPLVLLMRLRNKLQLNTYTKVQRVIKAFFLFALAAFWCSRVRQVFPGTWFWSFLALSSGVVMLSLVLYNSSLFLLRQIARKLRV